MSDNQDQDQDFNTLVDDALKELDSSVGPDKEGNDLVREPPVRPDPIPRAALSPDVPDVLDSGEYTVWYGTNRAPRHINGQFVGFSAQRADKAYLRSPPHQARGQPDIQSGLLSRPESWRSPPGDAPGACPGPRVVSDPRKPSTQLNSSRQLSLLIEGGADRSGIGISDDEHPKSMSVHTRAGFRDRSPKDASRRECLTQDKAVGFRPKISRG
jgi:hypothetical protein